MIKNVNLNWFIVGFGLLGVAIGYFVGFSATPVIGILLPLLFALIGGFGGVYLLTKGNLGSPQVKQQLNFMGKLYLVFSLCIIFSSAIALYLQKPNSNKGVLLIPFIENTTPKDAFKLLALRLRLEVLGASEEEQKYILSKSSTYITYGPSSNDEITKYLRTIGQESSNCLDVIKPDIHLVDEGLKNSDQKPVNLNDLIAMLKINEVILPFWSEKIEQGDEIPTSIIEERIQHTKYIVDQFLNFKYGDNLSLYWSSTNENLIKALAQLQIDLHKNQPLFSKKTIPNIPEVDTTESELIMNLITKQPSLKREELQKELTHFAGRPGSGT